MNLQGVIRMVFSEQELAETRLGLLSTAAEFDSLPDPCYEQVSITPVPPKPVSPACELICGSLPFDFHGLLTSALKHLTRDGLLALVINTGIADSVCSAIAEAGPYWTAVLPLEDSKQILLASSEIHPTEFGFVPGENMLSAIPHFCQELPQNRADRRRRRLVRRRGRSRLLNLAKQLHETNGHTTDRIVRAIELLAGERLTSPDNIGSRPGMFAIPDLPLDPWPTPLPGERLSHTLQLCTQFAPGVVQDMRHFIASNTLVSFVDDPYNNSKFQITSPNQWRALRIIDWRNNVSALSDRYQATNQLLHRLAPVLSGEVNVLRLAPGTALPPHHDDFDCEVYIQIGLAIPDACGIRVGNQERTWKVGGAVAFNPAFLHEVWNHGESPRDVMAIDTWHPDLSKVERQAVCKLRGELEALRKDRQESMR